MIMQILGFGKHMRTAGVVFAQAALLLALPSAHAQQEASIPHHACPVKRG
jgi:hypothetical protein